MASQVRLENQKEKDDGLDISCDLIVRFFDIVFNVTSKGMLNAVVFGFVLCFNLNLHPRRQQNKMFQTNNTVPKL